MAKCRTYTNMHQLTMQIMQHQQPQLRGISNTTTFNIKQWHCRAHPVSSCTLQAATACLTNMHHTVQAAARRTGDQLVRQLQLDSVPAARDGRQTSRSAAFTPDVFVPGRQIHSKTITRAHAVCRQQPSRHTCCRQT
jgi:hypothetical protein